MYTRETVTCRVSWRSYVYKLANCTKRTGGMRRSFTFYAPLPKSTCVLCLPCAPSLQAQLQQVREVQTASGSSSGVPEVLDIFQTAAPGTIFVSTLPLVYLGSLERTKPHMCLSITAYPVSCRVYLVGMLNYCCRYSHVTPTMGRFAAAQGVRMSASGEAQTHHHP